MNAMHLRLLPHWARLRPLTQCGLATGRGCDCYPSAICATGRRYHRYPSIADLKVHTVVDVLLVRRCAVPALILVLLSRYRGDLLNTGDGHSYAWFVGDCRAPQRHVGSRAGLEKIQVIYASEPQRFEGLLSSMLSLVQHLQEPAWQDSRDSSSGTLPDADGLLQSGDVRP